MSNSDNHYHTKTLTELSAQLQAGEVSSVALCQYFINRIKQNDDKLNSFISLCEPQTLAQAKQADQRLAKGNAPALTGVPIAHKDIFCTQGVKTSCGSKMLDNFISPYDATVVKNMQQAGVVMLGKTNMDEFAMGSSNETSYYGAVKNPWNLKAVPGGSSGGSAAAVAARIAPAATGTDTGGSIRQPAAFCGITGLKPTYGRVSRFGMIAFASSLDQAGPMAQSASDCALLLNAMAGFDEKDSTSIEKEVPDYRATLNQSLSGLRIGLPKEFFEGAVKGKTGEKNRGGINPAVDKVIRKALEQYQKLGAELINIELPNSHLSIPVYYVVAPAECSTNLSRYDGVRYGYRCENPKDLNDLYTRSRGEAFGAEVQRRIMVGTYALSSGYYDAYYLKAQKLRHLISDDFKKAYEKVDVIMAPTTPDTAFNIGEKSDDPIAMYLSDIFTIAVNLAGIPAMSIPVGFVDNMPVGMQIMGNHFEEAKLLNVAHQYQLQTNWHLQQPAEFA